MLWIVFGIALILFGLYHLVRHLRLEVEKKREADKDYKDYKEFIDKEF